MEKEKFFEKTLSDCKCSNDKVARLLRIRGYLIDYDKTKETYYLSDNAHDSDVDELLKIIGDYSIGESVRRPRENVTWGNCCTDRSILDIKFDSDDEDVNNLIQILFKQERKGGEAELGTKIEWRDFLRRPGAKKYGIACFEPFIAYYSKAISACGVETCYSCDGNHPNGGRLLCQSKYPFSIWHEILWEMVSDRFDIDGDIEKSIPFSHSNQYDLYYKIITAADWLYNNRISFREHKFDAVCTVRKKKKEYRKKNLQVSDDMCERWFRSALEYAG